MTIAELHGKLSADRPSGANDRMEDLLTSDVFGTMRYAGWSCGFLDWLLEAESPPALAPTTPISQIISPSSVRAIRYAFWPPLPLRREADLALLIDLQNGTSVLIIVEAKYLSGTSDFSVIEEGDDSGRTGN